MRTTLDLNDQLIRRAKQLALERGTTLTEVIEDALRQRLAATAMPRKRRTLPTFKGTGLQPGVDLSDTSALFELMDDDASP